MLISFKVSTLVSLCHYHREKLPSLAIKVVWNNYKLRYRLAVWSKNFNLKSYDLFTCNVLNIMKALFLDQKA